ncbi:hypothetical protein SLE2022_333260 [Rubroshorea leprosula]
MTLILNTVHGEAFFVLIINLLTGYILLLELSGLLRHVWPVVPCSLDTVIEAYTAIIATCAIMNFPKSMISFLIADAPSQDSTREAIV